MKIEFEVDEDLPPYVVGELILKTFDPKKRWGYSTTDLPEGFEKLPSRKVPWWIVEEFLGDFSCYDYKHFNQEIERILFMSNGVLDVYLYWDGDGMVIIENIKEGWMLSNTDIKNGDDWTWKNNDGTDKKYGKAF